MYTKEQLQAMSDFEVNKSLHFIRLTQKERKDLESIKFKSSSFEVRFKSGCNYLSHLKDYCNTPNDIMPLAFEYGVVINKAEDIEDYEGCKGWVASGGVQSWMDEVCTYGEDCFDTSPLRAIACCLILVLQERNK